MDFFSRLAERAMGTQPIVHPIRNRPLGIEGRRIEESAQEDLGRQPELLQNRVEQGPPPVPLVAGRTVAGRRSPQNHQEKEIEQPRSPNEKNPIQEPSPLLSVPDRRLPRNHQEKEIEQRSIRNKEIPFRDVSTDELRGRAERNQNVAVRPNVPNLEGPRVEKQQAQQRETIPTAEVFAATRLTTNVEKRINQPERVADEKEVQQREPVFGDQLKPIPSQRQRIEPRQHAWKQDGLQRNHSEPPTIKVTIGRVEVRAIQESTPPPKQKVSKAHPPLSLETYLDQRKRGER